MPSWKWSILLRLLRFEKILISKSPIMFIFRTEWYSQCDHQRKVGKIFGTYLVVKRLYLHLPLYLLFITTNLLPCMSWTRLTPLLVRNLILQKKYYFSILDIKNVSIVAHYIKDRTKNAQFIIISLRNQMFDLASKLVGIYKTDNTTKTVVMQNEQAKTAEKTQRNRNPSGSQVPSSNILQATQ